MSKSEFFLLLPVVFFYIDTLVIDDLGLQLGFNMHANVCRLECLLEFFSGGLNPIILTENQTPWRWSLSCVNLSGFNARLFLSLLMHLK